jgi:hypothetical protein
MAGRELWFVVATTRSSGSTTPAQWLGLTKRKGGAIPVLFFCLLSN